MTDYVNTMVQNTGDIILAIGALGTAAFGIVEGLKWSALGLSGFNTLKKMLGKPFVTALGYAYGGDYETLLQAQYRTTRSSGDLSRTLRQGVRAGLRELNAENLARSVGESVVSATDLKQIAQALADGKKIENDELRKLGRFELAADMRIDAAITAANSMYVGAMRGYAFLISVTISIAVGFLGFELSGPTGLGAALIIGIAAVPVAPIAKDLASALTSAANAFSRTRKTS